MDKAVKTITASFLFILTSSVTITASSEEPTLGSKGVNAFRACYETILEKGVVGAPILNIFQTFVIP